MTFPDNQHDRQHQSDAKKKPAEVCQPVAIAA